ncbi:cysteine-rich tail protein 1 [Anolis carolinensis]|uniref:cysteine-rich tail protein 1 n=1 Tax=Anolis carolinensis TaxID=28377 RepID=UPI002F2B7047
MDRGVTIKNPYASVSLPRAQLKEDFLRYSLGEDQAPGAVLYSPSPLPTYTEGPRVPTRESWAQPFNPYASLSLPNRGAAAPEPFHWKSQQAAGGGDSRGPKGGGCCCCCPCCCKRSPCSRRCRCVVS